MKPLGDRLISGFLAIPLISCWVKLVFPDAHILWLLAAPLPLGVYLLLLARTDKENETSSRMSKFTRHMLISIGIIYAIFIVLAVCFA